MSIDNIRLSQQAKDQLIKLKRLTGIAYWNELCRWGFCVSLAEPSIPTNINIPSDSNVEMSWRVFGGRNSDIFMVLLKMRVLKDGLPLNDETLAQQFRLHLHRGISYLSADKSLRGIDDLVSLVVKPA
ncbi:MAG: DNA sulfur modification protein DndE [Gammaproteobacteria bacterium]|nr:DNA sulfur modification protein DndE [Gammaproteobacteria bacterium]MCY4228469.1 DNA sulfur modification protein DndE [Gammaproteobacteria bacterium]